MFIPYLLKLRLQKYKDEKDELARIEADMLRFQTLPPSTQQEIAENIEVKMLSQIRSIARTKLNEVQKLQHNRNMRQYRLRKKAKRIEENGGFDITNYVARNPVTVTKLLACESIADTNRIPTEEDIAKVEAYLAMKQAKKKERNRGQYRIMKEQKVRSL